MKNIIYLTAAFIFSACIPTYYLMDEEPTLRKHSVAETSNQEFSTVYFVVSNPTNSTKTFRVTCTETAWPENKREVIVVVPGLSDRLAHVDFMKPNHQVSAIYYSCQLSYVKE